MQRPASPCFMLGRHHMGQAVLLQPFKKPTCLWNAFAATIPHLNSTPAAVVRQNKCEYGQQEREQMCRAYGTYRGAALVLMHASCSAIRSRQDAGAPLPPARRVAWLFSCACSAKIDSLLPPIARPCRHQLKEITEWERGREELVDARLCAITSCWQRKTLVLCLHARLGRR